MSDVQARRLLPTPPPYHTSACSTWIRVCLSCVHATYGGHEFSHAPEALVRVSLTSCYGRVIALLAAPHDSLLDVLL